MTPWRAAACALAVALVAAGAAAQSVTGTQGLLSVPTARMHADGTLVIGTGYVDRAYSTHQNGTADYTPLYASLTFLPSVEIGFRFTRALDAPGTQALGDRMFLARVRVLEEGPSWPAVAVGAHDFLRSSSRSTQFFNALYAVASKRVGLGELSGWTSAVDLHAGWGTDLIDASGHQFVGPFGGVAVEMSPQGGIVRQIALLAEYDGSTVSVGPRIEVAGVVLTAGIQGFRVPIAAAAVRVGL